MKDSKISLFVLWLAVLLAAVLMTGCASQASIAR
jgi:outer membrane murein-binding lipoprotein Lpp